MLWTSRLAFLAILVAVACVSFVAGIASSHAGFTQPIDPQWSSQLTVWGEPDAVAAFADAQAVERPQLQLTSMFAREGRSSATLAVPGHPTGPEMLALTTDALGAGLSYRVDATTVGDTPSFEHGPSKA